MDCKPIARPDSNEDDETLLKLQEQFIKDKNTPSVKLIKSEKKDGTPKENIPSNNENKKESVDQQMIIHDIIEKDIEKYEFVLPKPSHESFPEVVKLEDISDQPKSTKRLSLFAKQRLKSKLKTNDEASSTSSVEHAQLSTGHGIDEIRNENDAKLSKMSENEKLSEQRKLLETLDPKLIDFIRSRKKPKKSAQFSSCNAAEKQRMHDTSNKIPKKVSFVENSQDNNSLSKDKNLLNVNESNCDFDMDVMNSLSKMDIAPGKWANMNKIEVDKLKWMTETNTDEDDKSKEHFPRFDLEGQILSIDAKIDFRAALHHHANEPERAGYTIDEIFVMIRSTTIPQRVLGLQILGKILHNNFSGCFLNCFDSSLLGHLLNAGIVPLLRFAMDDNTETVVSAAVYATKNLLFSEFDEHSLDHVFNWHDGHLTPFLAPDVFLSNKDLLELSDQQLVEQDVISGFLRMDLIPRLVYISNVITKDKTVLINVMQILIRICHQSSNSVRKILYNSQLMNFIYSQLRSLRHLISSVDSNDVLLAYYSLRMLRVAINSNKDIANEVNSKFQVVDVITVIIGGDYASNLHNAKQASYLLCLESLRTWKSLLSYGLGIHAFIDLYSVIMNHCQSFIKISIDSSQNNFDYVFSSTLLSVLEEMIILIATDESSQAAVDLNLFHGLFSILEICLRKWFWHLTNNFCVISDQCKTMISKSLDVISTFLTYSSKLQHKSHAQVEACIQVLNQSLPSFFESQNFSLLLKEWRQFSCILNSSSNEVDHTPNLMSIGYVFGRLGCSPILKNGCPIPLLFSLSSVIEACYSRSGESKMLIEKFLNHDIKRYLQSILKKPPISFQWCKRFELNFIFNVIKLTMKLEENDDSKIQNYQLALSLMPHFQYGDEKCASELLNNYIFNFDLMKLVFSKNLMNDSFLMKISECHEELKKVYLNIMIGSRDDSKKKISLCVKGVHISLFPSDWMYLPLVSAQHMISSTNSKEVERTLMESDIKYIYHCILFVLYLQSFHKFTLKSMKFSIHYCRLACVFLLGNNTFMNPNVQNTLTKLLFEMTKNCSKEDFDFQTEIPGVPSFLSFYEELLNQYKSSSYGNILFGSFLMIPIQQHCPSNLKISLWTHHSDAVRILSTNKILQLFPVKEFFEPSETDETILGFYFTSLTSNMLRSHNSLIYYIILHHIHQFMQHSTKQPNQSQLFNAIKQYMLDNQHEKFVADLNHYKELDFDIITSSMKSLNID